MCQRSRQTSWLNAPWSERTKYVDASPSTVEGGYSPMNKPEGYTLSSQLVHQFGGRRTGATQA